MKELEQNSCKIVVLEPGEAVITDAQAALDLVMTVQYETGAHRIAIPKESLPEQFFVLSSGLAGEVLQKFINYHMKLAVFGDFSGYTSKPLRDFIYESNRGKDIFFPQNETEAVLRLSTAAE